MTPPAVTTPPAESPSPSPDTEPSPEPPLEPAPSPQASPTPDIGIPIYTPPADTEGTDNGADT